MGWWQDMWKAIADWFMDKIIRPLITWITNAINKITATLKIWRHNFLKALTNAMADNQKAFGMLIFFVIASVVVVAAIPIISAAIADSAIAGFVEAIKEGVGKVSALFINLEMFNSLLKLVWPEYRELMGSLNKAVAGLMGELELDVGFLSAWFAALNSTLVATAAVLGLPQEAAMIDYMNQAAQYTKRLDEKFARYAYDPGLIVSDFIQDVLLPAADTLTEAQRAALEESYDRLTAVETKIGQFLTWKQSISDLIDALPDEIAAEVNRHWLPVEGRIDAFFEEYNSVLLPAIDAFQRAITWKLSIEADRTDQIEARLEDPYAILAMYELYPREDKESFQDYLARIAGLQYDRDAGAAEFGLLQAATALENQALTWFTPPVALKPAAERVLRFELPEVKTGTIARGWFQGEY